MKLHKTGSEYSVAAFSLVEVVVSMVILSLILGSVFGVVWQATDSAAELRGLDARDQQVSRFLSLYRKTLESLPVGTSLTITPAEESTSGQEEMKIEGATTAYAMGVDSDTDGETIIALRAQAEDPTGELADFEGTLFQVAVSRETFKPIVDGDDMAIRAGETDPFFEIDDEGRYWLPLLNNVVSMTWRYWDSDQREWMEIWEEDSMPEMLELSLLDPWRPAPLRVIFEMPSHLVEGNTGGQSTTGSNTNTTQSSGGNSNQASGGRPPAGGQPARDGARGGGDRSKGRSGGKDAGNGEGRDGGGRPAPAGGSGGRGGGSGGTSGGGSSGGASGGGKK